MSNTQVFVLVNVLGGVAVLGSYALGLLLYPETRMSLWGGIQGNWQTIFTVSMLPAAIGYLFFFYVMVFRSGTEAFTQTSVLGVYTPSILCAAFLISATVWMPSTIAYLNTQQTGWRALSVASLWITALSLIALLLVMISVKTGPAFVTTYKYIAVAGLSYIVFHCLVLDAIVWIARFPKPH